MKVNPTTCLPMSPLVALGGYFTARLRGSTSRVPHLLAHLVKRV